jgi:hypothetical protein
MGGTGQLVPRAEPLAIQLHSSQMINDSATEVPIHVSPDFRE